MEQNLEKPIAYTVEHQHMIAPLPIRLSANAWWMDRGKVEWLISALALGLPIKEACIFAGISLDKYKYFVDCHPNFSEIKRRFELMWNIKARMLINKEIENGNVRLAKWFLEKNDPQFGSEKERALAKTEKDAWEEKSKEKPISKKGIKRIERVMHRITDRYFAEEDQRAKQKLNSTGGS